MSIKSRQELIKEIEKGESFEYLFFWDFRPKQEGVLDESCLSQWYPSPFYIYTPIPGELMTLMFPTAEHYMMYKKATLFYDYENAHKILKAKTPKEAKRLGREVKNFDESKWSKEAFEIVVAANINKFMGGELEEYLLSTGDKILVEASANDSIWGIGLEASEPRAKEPLQWLGENRLGFALMKVRRMIREGNMQVLVEYWGW